MQNELTGREGPGRIVDVIVLILLAILLLVAALLSIGSLLATSYVADYEEHIAVFRDNILCNIAVVAAFVFLLKYTKRFFKSINPKRAMIVLICYTTVLGVFWVLTAQTLPRADQLDIQRNIQMILNNDFSGMRKPDSYLQLYPFQLGIVFIFEMLLRLFGPGNLIALEMVNVVWLDLAYIAIIFLARQTFNNKKIELLTTLLLFFCLQPILFCPFLYGNLMGLAFSLWAVYFIIKFMQTGKKGPVFISAALICVALLAKLNSAVVLIAICVILLLYFIKKRGWFSLVAVAIIVAISFGVSGLVQKSYEWRSSIPIGGGIPQTAWLEMGLQQDSPRYVGWYNGYTYVVYRDSGFNTDAAAVQVQTDLKNTVDSFMADIKYAASFFAHKTVSQWNEPSFESIYVSRGAEPVAPAQEWVFNLYYGSLNGIAVQYFDFYVQIVYVGFAAAMFFAIKRKKDLCFLAIPLVILGGFAYHLLFEAKSQYILVYFFMMIPYAAWGYYRLVNIKLRKREGKKETAKVE